MQIWLCCVQGMAHALLRAGGESASALCASWRWLVQRCPRNAISNSLPQTWPPAASLACAAASVVLRQDDGEGRRDEAERLLREAVRLLLSDSEQHQLAGSAALGQLRGGSALQLVLSELATPMRQVASETEWARHATKNPASRCHMHTRQLCHVLSLLSGQHGWAELVATCGAPLAALSHFTHSVIEYLEKPWNLHAWSLQRTRVYVFTFMSRCTPQLLAVLANHVSGEQRAGLRPTALLSRFASLLHASAGEGAAQALDTERGRLLLSVGKGGAGVSQAGADVPASSLIEGELRAQAGATQMAALGALSALATPEAVSTMENRRSLLVSTEALLHSHSTAVVAAARHGLGVLWASGIEPLLSCLERCYTSATHVVANAHFVALVPVALRTEEAMASQLRVSLLVLAVSKLSDTSAEVRASALLVLHAHGAVSKTCIVPSLLAEGLPWTAPVVQLEISSRLAATLPALASHVVLEILKRARTANPSAAGMLLAFLPPWIEQACLPTLALPRPPVCAPLLCQKIAASHLIQTHLIVSCVQPQQHSSTWPATNTDPIPTPMQLLPPIPTPSNPMAKALLLSVPPAPATPKTLPPPRPLHCRPAAPCGCFLGCAKVTYCIALTSGPSSRSRATRRSEIECLWRRFGRRGQRGGEIGEWSVRCSPLSSDLLPCRTGKASAHSMAELRSSRALRPRIDSQRAGAHL